MGSWVPELEQMNHISPREEPHSSPIEETATEIKRNLRIKKYLRYFAYALVLMSLTQGLSNIISPNVDLFEFDLFTSINIPSVLFNLAFVALLEESLLRWLPFRILRRYSEHENFIHFMLFLYFLIGAATHMTNISSAPPFEAMKYFGIHGWGGFVLGYVYIREKFRASFSTHFMYNSLLYFRYLSYFFVKEIISIV
jgi:membrane protease YdiL (CAAX protease family)